VRWNRSLSRFQILSQAHRFGYQRTVVLHTVQEPDGDFRPLDERTMVILRKADTHVRGVKQTMREMEEENVAAADAKDQSFRNDVEAISKESRKSIKREVDNAIGAINVPKEDLAINV
jgi:hypothetical protein